MQKHKRRLAVIAAALVIPASTLTFAATSNAVDRPLSAPDSAAAPWVPTVDYRNNPENDQRKTYCRSARNKHARSCFQPHGDRFWVKDQKWDGQPVAMHLVFDPGRLGGRRHYAVIYDNYGQKAGWTGRKHGLDLPVGYLKFQTCEIYSLNRRMLDNKTCSLWTKWIRNPH